MKNKPMPLKDLPAYIDSVREHGQTEIPVVEMGMIVEPRGSGWLRAAAYSAAACLLVGVAGFYMASATERITIAAGDLGPAAVAGIVRDEGGRVFSVRRNEDSTYEVRVLNFKNTNYFLERLRRNKQFESVELGR